ncbi:Uncharacterised protein [Yersinia frederiksenii]|nr:Uncharacterised protein [Yersinia frederiksenii]
MISSYNQLIKCQFKVFENFFGTFCRQNYHHIAQ